MFIGHFAVGMAAKSAVPKASLGTLFLAAQFVDLLWPTLLLLGLETVSIEPGITAVTPLDFESYPISHSLLMSLVWGTAFGLVYWFVRKDAWTAVVLGAAVVSHWLLDLIVHRPDLPLTLGESPHLGLGLWHSLPATLLVEGLLFAAGVIIYRQVTRPRNRVGSYVFVALIGFLLIVYVANLFGPPPPSVTAIAWAGQLQWLLIAWGYWVDSNRRPTWHPDT